MCWKIVWGFFSFKCNMNKNIIFLLMERKTTSLRVLLCFSTSLPKGRGSTERVRTPPDWSWVLEKELERVSYMMIYVITIHCINWSSSIFNLIFLHSNSHWKTHPDSHCSDWKFLSMFVLNVFLFNYLFLCCYHPVPLIIVLLLWCPATGAFTANLTDIFLGEVIFGFWALC